MSASKPLPFSPRRDDRINCLPTPESLVDSIETEPDFIKPSPSKRTQYNTSPSSRSNRNPTFNDVSEIIKPDISHGACTSSSSSLHVGVTTACSSINASVDRDDDHPLQVCSRELEAQAIAAVLSAHSDLELTGNIFQENNIPTSIGGYCDVYRGLSLAHASIVAIKRFRVHIYRERSFAKSLARELHIWSKLHHPNVLPLLGYTIDNGDYPSLVSPWMNNGTIIQYLNKNPTHCIMPMVKGIAEGLRYLHSMGVSHSDLKSDNVLVSSSGMPLLADFGISRMVLESLSIESKSSLRGSVRWMAVEMFDVTPKVQFPRSKRFLRQSADIWAFGMTVYEILTLKRPYHHILNDVQVIMAIIRGNLPHPPERVLYRSANYDEIKLWELCRRCWEVDLSERPSIQQILQQLNNIETSKPPKSHHESQLLTPVSSVFDSFDLDEEGFSGSHHGSARIESSGKPSAPWHGQMHILKQPRDEYMAQYMARRATVSGLSALRPLAKSKNCRRSSSYSSYDPAEYLQYRPRTKLRSQAAGVVASDIAVFVASDGKCVLSWMGTTRVCERRRAQQGSEDSRGPPDVIENKAMMLDDSGNDSLSGLVPTSREEETYIYRPGTVFKRVIYPPTLTRPSSTSVVKNSCTLIACSPGMELSLEGCTASDAMDVRAQSEAEEETARKIYRSLERIKKMMFTSDRERKPGWRWLFKYIGASVT